MSFMSRRSVDADLIARDRNRKRINLEETLLSLRSESTSLVIYANEVTFLQNLCFWDDDAFVLYPIIL